MKNSTRKFALGTIFAAIAGYLAGILTAPKSGKQTRSDIKSVAETAVIETEKQLKKIHTELNQLVDEVKAQGEKLTGRAKGEYDDAVDKAKQARQKAREVLSAVHEGDVDDKDLKGALSDGAKALKHLKSFLKKPA